MSQTSKIVLGVAVLAVIALGIFYYWHAQQGASSGTSPQEVTTLPSGSSTDDASIEKDLSSVDTQLSGVASDNADAQASVQAVAAQ